ncbi:MAG: ABC transporter substrate-binding protein [Rhodospirillaceae bacterium]|nr:ABC transporter substrate-binding protein [Rhodospirillaceae bacterium]
MQIVAKISAHVRLVRWRKPEVIPLVIAIASADRAKMESIAMTLTTTENPFGRWCAACSAVAGALALTTVAITTAQASGPAQAIQDYHTGLLGVMKQAKQLGFKGRAQRLKPMISQVFDLGFLSRRIVGRTAWRALSTQQRLAYVAAFSRLTVATYAGRFNGYSGEKFVTTGVENIDTKYVLVKTDIVKSDGGRIPLNYLMQRRDGRWKVIDVYLKGTISEVAIRRAEFRVVMSRSGINGLIHSIEKKARAAQTRT